MMDIYEKTKGGEWDQALISSPIPPPALMSSPKKKAPSKRNTPILPANTANTAGKRYTQTEGGQGAPSRRKAPLLPPARGAPGRNSRGQNSPGRNSRGQNSPGKRFTQTEGAPLKASRVQIPGAGTPKRDPENGASAGVWDFRQTALRNVINDKADDKADNKRDDQADDSTDQVERSFRKRHRCCLITTGVCGLLTIIMIPILFTVLIPAFAQKTVNDSHIILKNAVLSHAGATSINMEADITAYEAGVFPAKIHTTEATVYSPDGMEIGKMTLPELDLQGGATNIHMMETLMMKNPGAFQHSLRQMTMGDAQNWRLAAKSHVQVMGFKFPVKLNMTLELPALKLMDPQISNLRLVMPSFSDLFNLFDGPSHLIPKPAAHVDFVFFTTPNVTLMGPETSTFNVTDMEGNMIATAMVPNLGVHQGYNKIENVALTLCVDGDMDAVKQVFESFNDTSVTNLMMSGPMKSSMDTAPVLNHIMDNMHITLSAKELL